MTTLTPHVPWTRRAARFARAVLLTAFAVFGLLATGLAVAHRETPAFGAGCLALVALAFTLAVRKPVTSGNGA
jgi:hypothetical protein